MIMGRVPSRWTAAEPNHLLRDALCRTSGSARSTVNPFRESRGSLGGALDVHCVNLSALLLASRRLRRPRQSGVLGPERPLRAAAALALARLARARRLVAGHELV